MTCIKHVHYNSWKSSKKNQLTNKMENESKPWSLGLDLVGKLWGFRFKIQTVRSKHLVREHIYFEIGPSQRPRLEIGEEKSRTFVFDFTNFKALSDKITPILAEEARRHGQGSCRWFRLERVKVHRRRK